MKKWLNQYVPLLARPVFWLVLLAITVLSLWPGNAEPPTSPWSDKISHALAYFTLGTVLQVGWFASTKIRSKGLWALLGWSALMELIQGTELIGRTSSVLDMLANGTGLVLAALLVLIFRSLWQRL